MKNMELTNLEELIDRQGPNLDSWGDERTREQAQALLQSSEAARTILRDAQTVNNLLPKALYVPFPNGLEQQILTAIAALKPLRRTWPRICANWILKPALAVVPLALGFAIGFTQTEPSSIIEDEITTVHFEDHTNNLFLAND